MNLSLAHMEQILALERLRHFGRAAEAVGMSQPAFSRSLSRIESELGGRLFERSRAGVEPTEAGHGVIEHARQILQQASAMQAHVVHLTEAPQMTLSLACAFYPAALSLPEALAGLNRRLPKLTLELEIGDWYRALSLIQLGTAQLGLCELGESAKYPELRSERVARHAAYFVVRKGHPLARQPDPDLQALLDFPWVCSRIPGRVASVFGSRTSAAGTMDRKSGLFIPAVTSPSISTAIRLVTCSDLVTPVPLSAAREALDSGALQIVRFSAPWVCLNYGFVWRRDTTLQAGALEFMAQVRSIEREVVRREQELAIHFGCTQWDPRLRAPGPATRERD